MLSLAGRVPFVPDIVAWLGLPALLFSLPSQSWYVTGRGLLSPSDQESESSEEMLKVTVALEFAPPPRFPPIAMTPMNYNL